MALRYGIFHRRQDLVLNMAGQQDRSLDHQELVLSIVDCQDRYSIIVDSQDRCSTIADLQDLVSDIMECQDRC